MKTVSEQLPEDVSQLKHLVLQLQDKLQKKESKIQWLIEQFHLAQQRRFGKSSEAHVGHGQQELFNEAEAIEDESADSDQSESETITYQRNKPKRKSLPKDLPREVIEHDLEEADKVCDCCGDELHRIGADKSEKLEFIPDQVKVIEHVRFKYSCRRCEKENTQVAIKTAPVPPSPIPKSIATPSLLAQIITAKYQYALPLYRQESLFKQYGIELNRKTLSGWIMKSAELLKPIYKHLISLQRQQNVIHADETPVKVIREDKAQGYIVQEQIPRPIINIRPIRMRFLIL